MDGPSVTFDVFFFMQRQPNALVTTVNHKRMSVLLATVDDQEACAMGVSRRRRRS